MTFMQNIAIWSIIPGELDWSTVGTKCFDLYQARLNWHKDNRFHYSSWYLKDIKLNKPLTSDSHRIQ